MNKDLMHLIESYALRVQSEVSCPVPAAELEHLRGRIPRPVLKHLSDPSVLTELTDFTL